MARCSALDSFSLAWVYRLATAKLAWQFRTAVSSGLGIFADTGQRFPSERPFDVALGDLDGDGDLDAFITHALTGAAIWFNDGTGFFHQSEQRLSDLVEANIVLGDLDEDGDLDAFMTRRNQRPSAVLLNDGRGYFTDTRLGAICFSWGI